MINKVVKKQRLSLCLSLSLAIRRELVFCFSISRHLHPSSCFLLLHLSLQDVEDNHNIKLCWLLLIISKTCSHGGFRHNFHLCFCPVLPFLSWQISHADADNSFPACSWWHWMINPCKFTLEAVFFQAYGASSGLTLGQQNRAETLVVPLSLLHWPAVCRPQDWYFPHGLMKIHTLEDFLNKKIWSVSSDRSLVAMASRSVWIKKLIKLRWDKLVHECPHL